MSQATTTHSKHLMTEHQMLQPSEVNTSRVVTFSLLLVVAGDLGDVLF